MNETWIENKLDGEELDAVLGLEDFGLVLRLQSSQALDEDLPVESVERLSGGVIALRQLVKGAHGVDQAATRQSSKFWRVQRCDQIKLKAGEMQNCCNSKVVQNFKSNGTDEPP